MSPLILLRFWIHVQFEAVRRQFRFARMIPLRRWALHPIASFRSWRQYVACFETFAVWRHWATRNTVGFSTRNYLSNYYKRGMK